MQPNAGQHQQYDSRFASHSNEAINHRRPNPDMQQDAKRPRVDMRRPSDEEEREAGLALAGLGLSLTPTLSADAAHGDSEHEGQDKKPTIKSTNKKGGRISETGKARNACKECRRLKSKCDKQIPCSTCRSHAAYVLDRADCYQALVEDVPGFVRTAAWPRCKASDWSSLALRNYMTE
jgi:hypothetical protein